MEGPKIRIHFDLNSILLQCYENSMTVYLNKLLTLESESDSRLRDEAVIKQ